MKKAMLLATLCVAAMAVVTSCNSGKNKGKTNKHEAAELSGAGATFPLPFYNVIFERFSEGGNGMVAYGGIGSGGGVRNLKDGIVDFAGSDAFLSDEEMASMAPVIHIPTCMGAVVLAYNLPGIDELNLSGEVIADIFAGKIHAWNDNRVKALNPNTNLPSAEIIPVYRSDGSGTTFVFTDYLSKVSENWKQTLGTGKSISFPVGQAAKGNPGVAGVVSQTANTIGYVGSEYAFAQKIPYAAIMNANGELVKPTAASISAAASGDIPQDTRTSITNSNAQGAYPISCFTWLVIYKEQNYAKRSIDQALTTVDLLKYVLSDEAQKITAEVHYAPLPAKAVELSLKNLQTVTYDGKPLDNER